jgi:hypothetical protein
VERSQNDSFLVSVERAKVLNAIAAGLFFKSVPVVRQSSNFYGEKSIKELAKSKVIGQISSEESFSLRE